MMSYTTVEVEGVVVVVKGSVFEVLRWTDVVSIRIDETEKDE